MQITRDYTKQRLHEWGTWLRSARSPNQGYSISQMDSPLTKKRNVKAVYRSEESENLDIIMSFHMERNLINILELSFADQVPNMIASARSGCSIRSYTNRRNEAISMLTGILSVIYHSDMLKIA